MIELNMNSDKARTVADVSGVVMNIQRFSLNDGPGIRTTVFLKGCPLRCIWCHNPESNRPQPEISYNALQCLMCGACAQVCVEGVHKMHAENGHVLDRSVCKRCGKCVESCPGALEMIGITMTAREVIEKAAEDAMFYGERGGITLSGGEPLMQPDFTLEILKLAREEGFNTALETSGFGAWSHLERIAEYTDLFLYDYKETNDALHKQYTGHGNKRVLGNLSRLNSLGAGIVLRCPIIPGCNDREDHFQGIADTVNRFENIFEVNIEPYHNMGTSKAALIGESYALKDVCIPEPEQVKAWISCLQEMVRVPVKRA